MRIVDVIRISVLQQAACHDPYTGGNHGRLGAVSDAETADESAAETNSEHGDEASVQ